MKHLLVALATGACVAALAYATSRLIQVAFFPEPDPRTVMTVLRIGFFWRAAIAGYGGLLAAIGAFVLHARWPAVVDRWLPRFVLATAIVATAQGLLVP